MSDPVFASVDLGAHRVKVFIGTLAGDGMMQVTGIGFADSRGMNRGVVIDLNAAAESVREAIRMASDMAGRSVTRAAVSISGQHISCMNSSGEISLGAEPGSQGATVRQKHVDEAMCHARSVHLSVDKCLLHTIAQNFTLDGKQVEDPLGLTGHRLKVEAHLVLSGITSRDNLLDVMELAGIQHSRIVFSPIADALVTLSPEDLRRGIALVNIGAGTSEAVYFWQGGLRHSRVERYAGSHIRRDVAMVMKTTLRESEELVQARGCVGEPIEDEELSVLHIQGTGRQRVSRGRLARVIQARASEILKGVADEARLMHAQDSLGAGLVLTGGSSKLEGMTLLATTVTQMRSRIGSASCFRGPRDVLSAPSCTTGMGLLALEAESFADFDRSSVPMLDQIRLFSRDGDGESGRGLGRMQRMLKWRKA